MDTNLEKKPEVSITLCTYNRAQYLSFAIDSVLKQTFQEWELLILDDASTDETASIVQTYQSDPRIRYIRHEHNLGITKNRNVGLRESRGAYIAVLDSDDVWLEPNKLSEQVAFLDEHSDYAAVGTNMLLIDEQGKEIKKISYALEDADIRRQMLIRNQIAQSSVVFRKSAAMSVGNYDEQLFIWEDWDLWLRLGSQPNQKGKLKNLPFFAIGYREHSEKISLVNKRKGVETSLQIIERYKNSYPNYFFGMLKLRLKLLLLAFHL